MPIIVVILTLQLQILYLLTLVFTNRKTGRVTFIDLFLYQVNLCEFNLITSRCI